MNGIPLEIWLAIGECLSWPQVLLLANSCTLLVPLRHALDLRLQHLLMPDRVAEGMLNHRMQVGSKYIQKLITKDNKRNSRALQQEVEKGMGIIPQWWKYEPPAEEKYRQPQHVRHSELGYAVLRSARSGLRILALQGIAGLEKAYRERLIERAEDMLVERIGWI